jgi:hypothetical protein
VSAFDAAAPSAVYWADLPVAPWRVPALASAAIVGVPVPVLRAVALVLAGAFGPTPSSTKAVAPSGLLVAAHLDEWALPSVDDRYAPLVELNGSGSRVVLEEH